MAAYCIFEIRVDDPAQYREYAGSVPATIEAFGGEYLVRGGDVTVLEGDWRPQRLVVLRFPSVEQAQRWHDSQQYAGPKSIRQRSARTRAVIVQGLEP